MIAIIDYGVGNLRSVEKAFQYIGYDARVTSDAAAVRNADAVVLPGVGAFSGAMENLKKYGMDKVVEETVRQDKPFLGICLGLQLLFDCSEEGGSPVKGLGLFEGSIKQFPRCSGIKVPHMGWNSVCVHDSLMFDGLPENPYFYFVHSYFLDAKDRSIVAADCDYGVRFDAAIRRGRVCATQFHPEKSGEAGLMVLKNWASRI